MAQVSTLPSSPLLEKHGVYVIDTWCKNYAVRSLKKNQTTPRPSEHPPVMGKKMSKRSGGIKRLQIQNHFMAFKQVPRCR